MTRRAAVRIGIGGVCAAVMLALAGCATQALNTARRDFYQGRFDQAERALDRKIPSKDRVLFLMERGMVRLFNGDYERSARDFIAAYDRLVELETYSVTRGGASMVVNDNVQDFRGFPYERTLLHAFTAKSHFGLGLWENAAVEARRLIDSLSPEALGDYPDDAYSRYVAGAALELIGDRSNARLQYQKAAELAPDAKISPDTGRPGGGPAAPAETELLVFAMMGRAPRLEMATIPDFSAYAEIYAGDQRLGRSYLLTDTADLASTSFQKDAARRMAKTLARVAMKESIAHELEKDNALLGELARLILIGILEQPDTRRWETLPRLLHVARVPCPPDLREYTIVFMSGSGAPIARRTVTNPLQRNGSLFVSFARDVGGPPES